MSICAFIGGKSGHTPKDNMEETSDDTIYSPSGSSNIVSADIITLKSTFQVLVKSYLTKCIKNSEESSPQSFHDKGEAVTNLRYVPYEQRRILPKHRSP